MCLLVETIKISNSIPLNLQYHNERLNKSVKELFGNVLAIDLREKIKVPAFAGKGVFRCRVEYDNEIRKIEFLPYRIKAVHSLKIIERDNIEYTYKFADRSQISELMELCGDSDDFLLVMNGLITDTSYANIVFKNTRGEWYTPSSYLLPGTKRASLINKGIIKEIKMTISDINKYSEARLINAMIDIDESPGIPVRRINF